LSGLRGCDRRISLCLRRPFRDHGAYLLR
jgi:hypothetical protein